MFPCGTCEINGLGIWWVQIIAVGGLMTQVMLGAGAVSSNTVIAVSMIT